MTFQGEVKNGVVVFSGSAALPDGTRVDIVPTHEVSRPSVAAPVTYAVSSEQKVALLSLIGAWKTDLAPNNKEVEQIIQEARMKKYG
jgi:hypothetical protein